MPQAELLVHRLAGHLRQPEVQSSEEREDESTHDGVVEVRQYEEAAVNGHVHGHVREEDPRHATNQEVEVDRHTEEHRHFESYFRSIERAHTDQEDEARWN